MVDPPSVSTPAPSVPVPSSPMKKERAWKKIHTEDLSPTQLASARKILRGNAEIADEYLSFGDDEENHQMREARLIWLQDEIERVTGGQ
jgi:hypothetical protein